MIRDFVRGEDVIDLFGLFTDLIAPEALGDADGPFAGAGTFNGTGAFTSTAGEVITQGKLVLVDIDGDGSSDFEINMRTDLGLTSSDFFLGIDEVF